MRSALITAIERLSEPQASSANGGSSMRETHRKRSSSRGLGCFALSKRPSLIPCPHLTQGEFREWRFIDARNAQKTKLVTRTRLLRPPKAALTHSMPSPPKVTHIYSPAAISSFHEKSTPLFSNNEVLINRISQSAFSLCSGTVSLHSKSAVPYPRFLRYNRLFHTILSVLLLQPQPSLPQGSAAACLAPYTRLWQGAPYPAQNHGSTPEFPVLPPGIFSGWDP